MERGFAVGIEDSLRSGRSRGVGRHAGHTVIGKRVSLLWPFKHDNENLPLCHHGRGGAHVESKRSGAANWRYRIAG